jgi:hypothetical protein
MAEMLCALDVESVDGSVILNSGSTFNIASLLVKEGRMDSNHAGTVTAGRSEARPLQEGSRNFNWSVCRHGSCKISFCDPAQTPRNNLFGPANERPGGGYRSGLLSHLYIAGHATRNQFLLSP